MKRAACGIRGWSLALLATLAGCATSHVERHPSSPPPTDTARPEAAVPTGSPVVEFLDAQIRARCLRGIRCEAVGRSDWEEAQSCHPGRPREWEEARAALVDAGRVYFDAGRAAACLEGLTSSSCRESPEACSQVFRGLVSPGDPCNIDAECGPAHGCLGDTCPSRCVPRPDLGEPCTFYYGCREGLLCWRWTRDSMEHRCQRAPGLGEPCILDVMCDRDALCNAGRCESYQRGDGESCADFWFRCADDLVCVGTGATATCGAGGAPGESCGEGAPCGAGGRCVDGRCAAISLPGEPCASDSVCPTPFYCHDGRCIPLPMAGESCRAAGRCARGRCIRGTCQTLSAGTPCAPSEDATFGDCDSGRCGAGACPTPALLGELCIGGECAAGLDCRAAEDLLARCLPRCRAR